MTDDWKQIQDDLRAGVYGDWPTVRQEICNELAERHPDHGISSSDVNHVAYAKVKSGDLTRHTRSVFREFPDGSWSIEAADPNY